MLYVVIGIIFVMMFFTITAVHFSDLKISSIFDSELKKIKEFQQKIYELEAEIRAMPDDDILKEIKEIQEKSLLEFKEQLKSMIGTYLEKKFNFVFIIKDKNVKVTENLKKAYKLLAEKKYGNDNVKIMTKEEVNNYIEKTVDKKLFCLTDAKPIKVIDTVGAYWHPGMKD